jgi:uncharacterized protein
MKSVFHSGELEVQALAGVQDMADRIGSSIRSSIPMAAQEFLSHQPLAIVGSIDERGRVWVSLLSGEPGFMQAIDEQTVQIKTCPVLGDPLGENLLVGEDIGMLVIEFASRKRMRINGIVEGRPEGGIYVRAREVYSNCPKYIQAREWKGRQMETSAPAVEWRAESLNERQQRWIEQADTFFIASFHTDGGADASHRGGNPGFIRVLNERELVWPDYSGNMMFQTLGNIAANPNAGLLFIDFKKGNTLQITGRASIIWDSDRVAEFAGAERIVEFQIDEAIEISGACSLGWQFKDYSRFNPV